jgi:adhesin HecA-like repeat protein
MGLTIIRTGGRQKTGQGQTGVSNPDRWGKGTIRQAGRLRVRAGRLRVRAGRLRVRAGRLRVRAGRLRVRAGRKGQNRE